MQEDEMDVLEYLRMHDVPLTNTPRDIIANAFIKAQARVLSVERSREAPIWTITILNEGPFHVSIPATEMRSRHLLKGCGFLSKSDSVHVTELDRTVSISFFHGGGEPGIGLRCGIISQDFEFVPDWTDYETTW